MVTIEDNKLLNKPLTLEKVKFALFNLNPNKSPRLDGFHAFFYKKSLRYYWARSIEVFRNGGSILTVINHTFLTLILKKLDYEEPGHFRPIAPCNTIYIFLSKPLPLRFKHILSKLIPKEHTTLVVVWVI